MQPISNGVFQQNNFLQVWQKQGTEYQLSGYGTPVAGEFVPNNILLPSTSTVQGYYQGQLLATAKGDGTGAYAGLTAGCNVNLDPDSTDTGQKVWNGNIIVSIPGLTSPMALLNPDGTKAPVNATCIQIATPLQGWQIKVQCLYMSGKQFDPAEITKVIAMLKAYTKYSLIYSTLSTTNDNITIFSY